MSKTIQEQFGQEIIDAVSRFAQRDIDDVNTLAANEFSHVSDPDLKQALAETLYGTRWLYKLGLALLADNHERFAHVRAQIIDYASVAEALLADIIVQAYRKGKLSGAQWQRRSVRGNSALRWNNSNPEQTVSRASFEWCIIVANESGIINSSLATKLHSIRTRRNTVHLTAKVMAGISYYAGLAKRSREAMLETVRQTKAWCSANP
jgi:hypothetical protein